MFLRSSSTLRFRHLRPSSTWAVTPRVFPTTGFRTIPAHEKLDEETWEWYTPKMFYPVSIGDIFNSRYQVLYKLGYGTTSTIWMCRDLQINKYVCMKSMVSTVSNRFSVERELRAYEALSEKAATSTLEAKAIVRQALDHFVLRIHDEDYNFLIHQPLGLQLEDFLRAYNYKGINPVFIKLFGHWILRGLQFIHSANVVHTDISPPNILMTIHDQSIFEEGEEEELKQPSARKIVEDGIIFEIRALSAPFRRWVEENIIPVICDFGEARTGSNSYKEVAQPLPYRAPEMLLHIPWYTPLDVWSFGCLMWHLMVGDYLFPWPENPMHGQPDPGDDANIKHLALMIAFLGPPPQKLLERSGPRARRFFNEDGSFKGEVPDVTLESALASSLKGSNKEDMTLEQCQLFLAFIRRALTWTQEDRVTVDELLTDPWLSLKSNPK